MPRRVPTVVHIFRSHEEQNRWDRAQDLAMTPDERMAILAELQRQVYGEHPPDVREAQHIR